MQPSSPSASIREPAGSARSCPGALLYLHRQKLSRTPQIVPINDKPLTKTAGQLLVRLQEAAKIGDVNH